MTDIVDDSVFDGSSGVISPETIKDAILDDPSITLQLKKQVLGDKNELIKNQVEGVVGDQLITVRTKLKEVLQKMH